MNRFEEVKVKICVIFAWFLMIRFLYVIILVVKYIKISIIIGDNRYRVLYA